MAQTFLRDTYRQNCAKGEVPPPSKLAKSFGLAAQAVQMVAAHLSVDVGAMLRRVLFDEATACIEVPYAPGSPLLGLTDKSDPAAQSVVQAYAGAFKRVCEECTALGKLQGGVFSHQAKGFVGLGLENLTDLSELRSLYSLLGGYGVAYLEAELLKVAAWG